MYIIYIYIIYIYYIYTYYIYICIHTCIICVVNNLITKDNFYFFPFSVFPSFKLLLGENWEQHITFL